ncbi:MAG: hypothetical protein STHCBS139747_000462 [Sporothrix thermara]
MLLTELPNELLDHIVSELPKIDIKSLRLAHSVFENTTSRRLFTTVVISKTKRDLESFLAIANKPRLAAIATRLVWYELMEDQNHCFIVRTYEEDLHVATTGGRSRHPHPTYSMLYSLAASAFWTEPYFTNEDLVKFKGSQEALVIQTAKTYLDRRQATQASTEEIISAAVRKLVNLHTIVAQPMPLDRVLAVSDEGYHLQAGLMQIETHDTAPQDPNGLFLFSRACLGDALTQRIQANLVQFVERHSATLKHMGLYDCVESTKLLVTKMAAMPDLQLASFRVRAHRPNDRTHPTVKDDYIVPEEDILAFVNKETGINPLNKTIRQVFSTAPFIWEPEDWPSAAYFDLVSCTTRHCIRDGQPDGIGLPGENDIDLGFQDDILDDVDVAAESYEDITSVSQEDSRRRSIQYEGPYYGTDSSQAESELGLDGMQDVDRGFGAPVMEDEAPIPYSEQETSWIKAWAEQITRDTAIDLDRVATEPLPGEPRWKTQYEQALLLADREADARHEERCCGRNTEASPRWSWMRVNSRRPGTDTLEQEIYYWQTTTPGRGHPTTKWTFYQEYKDGTAAHGHGVEPLDFFADWDSTASDDGRGLITDCMEDSVVSEKKNLRGLGHLGQWKRPRHAPSPIVRMYAEPSVDSRAFRKFLKNPLDRGEPMEADVDVLKLELSEASTGTPVTSAQAGAAPYFFPPVVKGHVVKKMLVTGITASPLTMEVGFLLIRTGRDASTAESA